MVPLFVSAVADDGDALGLRAARGEGAEDVEGEAALHGVVAALLYYAVHAAPAPEKHES